jgi:hypothetical protein
MCEATGESFDTKWFYYLLVARLFSAICLPGLWSLPFVSFFSPLLECFLSIKFGKVSSFK